MTTEDATVRTTAELIDRALEIPGLYRTGNSTKWPVPISEVERRLTPVTDRLAEIAQNYDTLRDHAEKMAEKIKDYRFHLNGDSPANSPFVRELDQLIESHNAIFPKPKGDGQ